MKKIQIGLTLSTLLIAGTSHADNDDLKELQPTLGNQWTLYKNDQLRNIKAYFKHEDGQRTRSFKIEAVLDGNLEYFVHMTLDFDSYKRWVFGVTESRLLKKVSPTEYIYYLVHRAPPGTPDRDAVLHFDVYPPTPSNPTLILKSTTLPDYLPAKPPYMRVIAENYTAKITRLPDKKLQYSLEGYVDPGGRIPDWSINYVQRSVPFNTILSMQRRLRQFADGSVVDSSPLPFPVY